MNQLFPNLLLDKAIRQLNTSYTLIANVPAILQNIEESPELKTMWDKYRKQFAYAKDITYEQIMDSIKDLLKYKAFR